MFCLNIGARFGVKPLCSIWDKVGLFGESIHKDHDGVIALGWRELNDGIHVEGLPRMQWNWE